MFIIILPGTRSAPRVVEVRGFMKNPLLLGSELLTAQAPIHDQHSQGEKSALGARPKLRASRVSSLRSALYAVCPTEVFRVALQKTLRRILVAKISRLQNLQVLHDEGGVSLCEDAGARALRSCTAKGTKIARLREQDKTPSSKP